MAYLRADERPPVKRAADARAAGADARQLALPPRGAFLAADRPRRLDLVPPYPAPEASILPARRRRRRAAAYQMEMPQPYPVRGKGRSLGTDPLSRVERAVAEVHKGGRSPRMLPVTRGDCLAFRAVDPGKAERRELRRGDRGLRLAPCPFVSCRHHLYLDVNPESGAIKINFPDLERMELAEPWPRRPRRLRVEGGRRAYLLFSGPPRQHAVLDLSSMEDTCSLDVGDRGERRDPHHRKLDLKLVGRKMNVVMERARQLLEYAQDEALAKATDGQTIRPLVGDPNDVGADDQ